MADEKRGRGRPRTPVKVSNYPVVAYMPDEDTYEQVRRAAQAQGMSISAWARTVLIREAERELRDAR